MDPLTYEQYVCVVTNYQLSLDALRRILRHDESHDWLQKDDSLARQQVIADCLSGKIKYKLNDEPGDYLYGVEWPLPLSFERNT